jgi:hypothetical protein
MGKNLNLLFVLALLLLNSVLSYAQTDVRMQSVFIYNFTRLIAWPSDYQNGDFVIAVYGNSPMIKEIEAIAQSKKAGNQNIVAKSFSSTADIDKCHIIYVPTNHSRRIEEIVTTLKAKNINALVVADNRNAIANGAVINFTVVDNRQRFELSQQNASSMGLNPGNEISRLAIVAD